MTEDSHLHMIYVQIKEDYCTEPHITFNIQRGNMSLCVQLTAGAVYGVKTTKTNKDTKLLE